MSTLKEFLQEQAYLWPYGVCPAGVGKKEDKYCPIDGAVEFSSGMDGRPRTRRTCPDCGSKLEIKYRFKISTKLENVPNSLRKHVEKPEPSEGVKQQ